MRILAIESSCDETAAAVIEDGQRILSNVVVSQIDIFAAYGGVIPEVAARSHLEVILPVIHKALADAELSQDEIDAIAVTHTPGLMGSLIVGTLTARMLAILWRKPLYAVHHLKSHIYANWLRSNESSDMILARHGCDASHLKNRSGHSPSSQATMPLKNISIDPSLCEPSVTIPREHLSLISATRQSPSLSPLPDLPEFPLLSLVISGGHTQIIYMPSHNQFEIIGTTRDDAVGECFDKVAKILGLPYPGGPAITACAKNGSNARYHLPHPQVAGLDFSFSGLKTAVLRAVQTECGLPITAPSYQLKDYLSEQQKADFAASFQRVACEILLEKLKKALEAHPEVKSIVFAGGVSANHCLRDLALGGVKGALGAVEAQNTVMGTNCELKPHTELLETAQGYFEGCNVEIYFPEPKFSGDNAAMVGAAAFYEIESGAAPTNPYVLSIAPRTKISENVDDIKK